MTLDQAADVAPILQDFGGDPQRAGPLAEFLGFEPIPNPQDQLAGALSGGLKLFLRGRGDQGFGVSELFRVGRRQAAPAEAGLWVCVLSDWDYRASDRDRARRRIARALVEHVPDRRSLALLVPPPGHPLHEAELVFPRTPIQEPDAGHGRSVTTIRAHLDLEGPTRFHRDLLRGLRIPSGANLLEVSRLWQQQFSVERVTTQFYQDYAAVRDRIAEALLSHNPNHPVVKSLSGDERKSWGTRQMGRVLFLWFLQAKQWLGQPYGQGSPTYLLDLWGKISDTEAKEYYRGLLVPLFFDALATGSSSAGENQHLGFVPYLNGGLFRGNTLEDRIREAGDISLPDGVFDPEDDKSLLGLLSHYRFTTQESTPDDQSVDPDPELLGRVFENLYQGDERHDSGTYYTPREIVHFMCREALDGYLRDATEVDQTTLDGLRETAVGSWDDQQPLAGVPVDKLVDALETARVCDPAVGSGAFLLGTIQEMVLLRRGIHFSQHRYIEPHDLYRMVSDWKRRIIENSLHGVDINPEAVEICRLRLWLSLVLDMDEPPPANSDWALPNLDFQIVAGDSLVDRVAGIAFVGSWPPTDITMELVLRQRIEQLVSQIRNRRQEFERTHRNPGRLRELRDLIARDQREIISLHLGAGLAKAQADLDVLTKARKSAKTALSKAKGRVDRLQSLVDDVEGRDFALVQKPFLWPIAFPNVLREGDSNSGFDIVLANPPYVRQEKIASEDQLSYEKAFPRVFSGTADLLVFFYGRALQILKPGGWLSFITSNKFMRAGYGEGIREHLASELAIDRVIDFGDLPLFDANGKAIAAYPAVLVGKRSDAVEMHASRVADLALPVRNQLSHIDLKANPENVRSVLENLDGLLADTEVKAFPQAMLRKDGWVLGNPALVRLSGRLMEQGTSLGTFVQERIYYGIKTGFNEAFVIDEAKRDELIEEDPGSGDLIKPWLRGRDIKRWRTEPSGRYIIAIQNSGDAGANNPWADAGSENSARDILRGTYPAIHAHLSWFETKLRARQDHGLFWWELRACAYYYAFASPKIIFNRFIKAPTFAYDTSGSYHNDACYFAVPPTPSVVAIVNSKVGWWLLSRLCTMLQNGYFQVFVQFLEQLPIPTLPQRVDQKLAEYVKTLASGASAPGIESEIDDIVYNLYSLSTAEVKLVEEWFEQRNFG